MENIKLSTEQARELLVRGECNMVGSEYKVSSLGLCVRFDEGGVLRVIDALAKRRVGRPSTRATIRAKGDSGIFADKVGKFLVGDIVVSVVEEKGSWKMYERKVRITRVDAKVARNVSDEEWHLMGCNWVTEKNADLSKELHLSHLGMGLEDEIGLYWFERVEE